MQKKGLILSMLLILQASCNIFETKELILKPISFSLLEKEKEDSNLVCNKAAELAKYYKQQALNAYQKAEKFKDDYEATSNKYQLNLFSQRTSQNLLEKQENQMKIQKEQIKKHEEKMLHYNSKLVEYEQSYLDFKKKAQLIHDQLVNLRFQRQLKQKKDLQALNGEYNESLSNADVYYQQSKVAMQKWNELKKKCNTHKVDQITDKYNKIILKLK